MSSEIQTTVKNADKQIAKNLPKLPYGEGSMSWFDNDTIIYKKTIGTDGHKKRISVYADNPKNAIKKMRQEENKYCELLKSPIKTYLKEDMLNWLETYRKPELKMTSYDRIIITYKITANDIQTHLNSLTKQNLAWSTVKKVFDLLNSYFRFKTDSDSINKNPMRLISAPSKVNMKPAKDIQYLKENEIPIFIAEANKLCDSKNKLKYKYGPAYVFVIFTGLRIGELIALKWKDIDFENKTVSITKTIEEVVNRKYDESNPIEMKKKNIKKKIQKEGSTKNQSTRQIALSPNAIDSINKIYQYSEFKDPNDYVIATKNGTANNMHNMYRRLSELLAYTKLNKGLCGPHMLRHTCASLLFAQNIPVEIIASILGNSPEVCRKTYIHFCQQQQANAIHKIPEFNIPVF
jgi:integrase